MLNNILKKIGPNSPPPATAAAPPPAVAPAKTATKAPQSASPKKAPAKTTGKKTATRARAKTAAPASGGPIAVPVGPVANINPAHNTLKDGSSFDGTWDPDTETPVEGLATFSNGDTMRGRWNDFGNFYEGVFTVQGTPNIVATGTFWYPPGATRPRLRTGQLTKGELSWEGEFDDKTTKGFLRTGIRHTKAALESGVFQELPGGSGITLTHGKQTMTKSGIVFEGIFDRSTGKRIEGKETAKNGVVSEGKWKWNGHNEILVGGVTTWNMTQAARADGTVPPSLKAKFAGTKNLAGNWIAGKYVMPTGDTTVGTYSVVPTSTSQKKFRLEKGLNDPKGSGGTVREGLFASKSGVTKLVHGRTLAKVTSNVDKKKCEAAKTPGAIEGSTIFRCIQEGDYTDEAFVGTTRLIIRESFAVEVASSTTATQPPVVATEDEEEGEVTQNEEEHTSPGGGSPTTEESPAGDTTPSAPTAGGGNSSNIAPTTPQHADPYANVPDQKEKEEATKNNSATDDEDEQKVAEPDKEDKQDSESSFDDDISKPSRLVGDEEIADDEKKIESPMQPPPAAAGANPQVEEDNALVDLQEEQHQPEEEEPPHERKVEIVTRTKLVHFDPTKEAPVLGLKVFTTACPAFLWYADTITTTTTPAASPGGKATTSTKTATQLLEYSSTELESSFLSGEVTHVLVEGLTNENDASLPSYVPPPANEIVDFTRMETSRGRKVRREAVSVTKAKSFGASKDPHSYQTRLALPQYIWVFVDDISAEEPDPLPIEASLALEDAFYKGEVDEVVFGEEFNNARVSLWEEPRRFWRVENEEPKPIRREVMTVAMALETETYLTAFLMLNSTAPQHPLLTRPRQVDGFLLCYDDLPPDVEGLDDQQLSECPSVVVPPGGVEAMTTRDRLIRFFRFYNRDKLSSVDSILESAFKDMYKGSLFKFLEEKYGPESDITEEAQKVQDETRSTLGLKMRPKMTMSRHIDVELHGDWTVATLKSRMLHIAHLKYCTCVFQDEDYGEWASELLRPYTRDFAGPQLTPAQRAVRWEELQLGVTREPGTYPPTMFETEVVPEGTVRCRFVGDETAVGACMYLAMRWQYNETQFKAPRNWTVAVGNHVNRDDTISHEKNANYLFRVAAGSQEHTEVSRFFGQKFKKDITKIERVQNTVLYEKYIQKRRQIGKEHHGDANEVRWMFHGTRSTEPLLMCSDGFDMRFCDKGFYGRASYFAYDAPYSHNFRHNNANGTASLFLALVTCGLVDERPAKDDTIRRPEPPCHSVKGPVTTSGLEAIMIYELNQAYPAYLVTYSP